MTKEEKKEWDELYSYVKNDILKYDKNLRLPKYFILRLKGLSEGRFISCKYHESLGRYSFKNILLTFKLSKMELEKSLFNRSKFKDEQHMTNAIMYIIERKINDVVNRLKLKEKVERKKVELPSGSKIEYKKKDGNKVANILKDLI